MRPQEYKTPSIYGTNWYNNYKQIVTTRTYFSLHVFLCLFLLLFNLIDILYFIMIQSNIDYAYFYYKMINSKIQWQLHCSIIPWYKRRMIPFGLKCYLSPVSICGIVMLSSLKWRLIEMQKVQANKAKEV